MLPLLLLQDVVIDSTVEYREISLLNQNEGNQTEHTFNKKLFVGI